MHKLTVLANSPLIQELMRRLEDGSIDAFSATERAITEIYGGSAPSVSVWIAEAKDLERAREILREVQAQSSGHRSPGCDYDLRGHGGEATCPECGRSVTAAAPDVPCPRCHEEVPAGFQICWNCGADLQASQEREA